MQQSSAVFAAHPDVDLSEVSVTQVHGTRYYLNSEGFKTVAPIQIAALTMYGEAQAGDGMPVRQTFSDVGAHAGRSAVGRRARRAGERARRRRRRPRASRRSARNSPARCCIEGIGSAQFIAETLVQMMQARRPPDAENPRMAQAPPSPFLNRTGLRVMADAFSRAAIRLR